MGIRSKIIRYSAAVAGTVFSLSLWAQSPSLPVPIPNAQDGGSSNSYKRTPVTIMADAPFYLEHLEKLKQKQQQENEMTHTSLENDDVVERESRDRVIYFSVPDDGAVEKKNTGQQFVFHTSVNASSNASSSDVANAQLSNASGLPNEFRMSQAEALRRAAGKKR